MLDLRKTNLISFLFSEEFSLAFETQPHKSPYLKWPNFKQRKGAELVRLQSASQQLRGGSRGPEEVWWWWAASSRGATVSDSSHPFWGRIRCSFLTASEVPALAQSDIQVTLVNVKQYGAGQGRWVHAGGGWHTLETKCYGGWNTHMLMWNKFN